MKPNLLSYMLGAAQIKDYGEHATFGAWVAGRKRQKQYLRAHRLGKFKRH